MTIYRLTGILAAALLALAAPADAEPVGFRYEIMWGGFHAGDLAITRDDGTGLVRTGMTIRTVGLFDRFLRLRFTAEGGSTSAAGASALVSEHYQTRFRNRYRETLLRVAYAPEARVVTDEVLEEFAPPPEDDSPNPPVPDQLRRGVMDPLTNMALAGQRAREALSGGPASFRTTSYDGRRAYDFETKVIGPRRINMHGRDYDTIHLTMTLKPLAGFKPKFVKLWDGAEYEVDIDPATLLPLRIRTDSFTAATVINALEPCTVAAAQCGPVATAASD
ncbi:hypothetical protein A6A04_13965 [Paramagnetospirillum marisnigri]|uniref:DUF3108 domain-containing protein n=1 Tax=Paramagnetospirillum marisnigri TaxID=1285242 RepID=A0A178MW41_9PROT|nr:DUF3108 domain-containing protein [Paramagnetospirillum marisnigri]OAN53705.1 hypothetical protein A6A04_13965 [Paramagnetospirillum marisnigri]